MLNYFLFLILCLSWGSTWVAIKVGVESVPPFFFAGSRFFVAGLLILGVTAALKGRREIAVRASDFLPLFAMSSLVVSICFALIFWGEKYVSASVTAIVVQGMIPIFLPVFSSILGHDGLTLMRKLSIAIGIVGLIFIFSDGLLLKDSSPESDIPLEALGICAIVVGTLAYCYGSVLGKPLLARNSSVGIAGWQNLIGGLTLSILSLTVETSIYSNENFLFFSNEKILFAWVWLVVVGSAIGFVLYIVLLKAWGANKVSPYAFATPLVAIVLEYFLYGTSLGTYEIIGLMLIFIAMAAGFVKDEKSIVKKIA